MADEKPEDGTKSPPATSADTAATEGEEQAPAPEPNPLVVALLAQFPGVEDEGEDAAGRPIVRVGADSLLEVMTWLRDDDATRFDYLADQTVTDWTERVPRFDVVYHHSSGRDPARPGRQAWRGQENSQPGRHQEDCGKRRGPVQGLWPYRYV